MSRFHARIIELPGNQVMVTLVDEELLGVRVQDEDRGIVIDVRREFYSGELVDEDEAIRLLEEADSLILVGSRIIRLAMERGLVNPDAILKIENVEYTQILKIRY